MKWRYAVASALGFVLLVVIITGWLVGSRSDEILGETHVGSIDASGMTGDELAAALGQFEQTLAGRERIIAIDGTSIAVLGEDLGFGVDTEATVDAAMAVGRGSFWDTLRSIMFAKRASIAPVIDVSTSRVEVAAAEWQQLVANQPFDGALHYEDGRVVLDPPRPGMGITRGPELEDLLVASFLGPPEDLTILATEPLAPSVSQEVAADALTLAERIVAGPVTLRSDDPQVAITFTGNQLGRALTSRVDGPSLIAELDPTIMESYLEPLQDELEAPPQDAVITITDDDQVVIEPSRPGGLIDPTLVVDEVISAAGTADRTGTLTYVEGTEAAFTTEDAEALGIKGKVSEFTTFHDCCQPRVQNIHRIADIVDGALVMPGEEFNVNEFVGPRTREKGFVPAPMILAGRFVDSVGGGISQFATTLYNAVFFGGYTDVTHTPHSFYFSRYPEGREATVSFPKPDLIFRNDTDAALLIKTEYTDTEITVKFFGDNGGIDVQADLSERSRFRNPVTEYQPDSSLAPGVEKVVSSGTTGWDVTVTRTITHPNGEVTVETWDERYRPQPRVVRRHPCSIPGSVQACPTTTTSTVTTAATTTTASQPVTTTTVAPTTTSAPTTSTIPETSTSTSPTTSSTTVAPTTTVPTTTTTAPT